MPSLSRYSLALVPGFAHPIPVALTPPSDPEPSISNGTLLREVGVKPGAGPWIVEGDGQLIYKAESWI